VTDYQEMLNTYDDAVRVRAMFARWCQFAITDEGEKQLEAISRVREMSTLLPRCTELFRDHGLEMEKRHPRLVFLSDGSVASRCDIPSDL
jgi:hypothetical protein